VIFSTRRKERRKMKIKKKLLSTAIASILMLTIIVTVSADSSWLPPGMDPPPPGFVKYKTEIYVTVANNPAKLGVSLTLTAFLVPPPPYVSGYGGTGRYVVPVPYTNVTLFMITPAGTTTDLGNFTTGDSGGVWASVVPDQLGTYTVWATWDGTMIHTPATSKKITFEVTEEGSSMYNYPGTPLPTGYWETPVSAEYREWYKLVGPWYMSGFGVTFNASSSGFNEYSNSPSTAHVLWKYKSGAGGLIGGVYGPAGYNRAENVGTNRHYKVVMGGLMYYQTNGVLYCIDAQTGLEKFRLNPYTGGGIFGIPAGPMAGPYGNLVVTPGAGAMLYTRIGNDLVWLDGQNGNIVRNVTIPTEWRSQIGGTGTVEIGADGACFVYWATANGNLTKWNMFMEKRDLTGTPEQGLVATFQEGIVYSKKVLGARTPNLINGDRYCSAYGDVQFPRVGFDTKTGDLLWNVTFNDYSTAYSITSGYGKVFGMCSDGYWRAWSMDTGLEVWKATYPDAYPWGYFTLYSSAAAYGNFYGSSYTGYVNCFDANTGENKWNYFAGKTTETSMGHYGYWGAPVVADGKIFVSEGSQHPISSPMERGANIVALNATTGEVIWKFSLRDGGSDPGSKAIAEGKLFITDSYTGYEFCFDKGKTAATLQVGPESTVYGSSVMIKGTVKDLSPAQPNTACVSDASMTPWMEYLNINGPIPTNATGVEVTLSVLDSNNNYRDIGTVTTDPYNDGFFSVAWTPEVPGKFTVYATFKGTNSYWSSNAATSFVVDEAPQTVQPAAPVDNTPMFIGSTAAIIAAIAIVGIVVVLMLRKRP
jgi:outer membrane protein assembly factor BamB